MNKVKLLILSAFFFPIVAHSQNSFEDLSETDKKQILDKVKKKVNELQEYIKITGDKTSSRSKSDGAITAAKKLFQDDAIIQVSSTNRKGNRQFSVEDYLYRLRALKYDKVTITFFDAILVVEPKLGQDGKLYGGVTMTQRFEGEFADGGGYIDETTKNVNYSVEQVVNIITGETVWSVALGDIEVEQTKSAN